MENVLKTQSLIHVDGTEIPIHGLINDSKRNILSNVYPSIPNQLIINALHELGIITASLISHIKAEFATEQFSHIISRHNSSVKTSSTKFNHCNCKQHYVQNIY